MNSKYRVSDAEREVLDMLWRTEQPIRQTELLRLFEREGKEWKRQTLNTLLARLEEKRLVVRLEHMVSTRYTEEEYNSLQVEEAIDDLYDGRVGRFLSAFARKREISDEDAEEILRIMNERKK